MTKRKKVSVSLIAGGLFVMKWFTGNFVYGLFGAAILSGVAALLRATEVIVNPYGLVSIALFGAALGLSFGPRIRGRIRPDSGQEIPLARQPIPLGSEERHVAQLPAAQRAAAEIVAAKPRSRSAAAGVSEPPALPVPSITPELAAECLSEIAQLEPQAGPLIEDAWNRQLQAKETGWPLLTHPEPVDWNQRVRALAKKTMSTKERNQVLILGSVLTNGFGITAEKVEEVIRGNLQTLRIIAVRCRDTESGE